MFDSLGARLRTAVFGIAPSEARLEVRGFARTTPEKQQRLEDAGRAFIQGYLIALDYGHPELTAHECDLVAAALRGFAYEGASMGLALIDLVTRGTPRLFRAFAGGPASAHVYMAHVGAGWALARFWGLATFLPRLDPVLKWLALDGLGFHEAFFHPADYFGNRRVSWKGRQDPDAFDAGLGRALWFASGAQAQHVLQSMAAFPPERRPAFWSGIGLAATYAGGADASELHDLLEAAGEHRHELRLGSAFAAKARTRAGNPTAEAARACEQICGLDLQSASALTDECLRHLPAPYSHDTYRQWRQSIKAEFAQRLA